MSETPYTSQSTERTSLRDALRKPSTLAIIGLTAFAAIAAGQTISNLEKQRSAEEAARAAHDAKAQYALTVEQAATNQYMVDQVFITEDGTPAIMTIGENDSYYDAIERVTGQSFMGADFDGESYQNGTHISQHYDELLTSAKALGIAHAGDEIAIVSVDIDPEAHNGNELIVTDASKLVHEMPDSLPAPQTH